MSKRSDFIIRNSKSKNKSRFGKRTVIIATALSVVCVAAMFGIYRMETRKKSQEESLVNWADTASTDSDKVNVKLSDKITQEPTPTAAVSKNDLGIENNFSDNTASLEDEILKATQSLDEINETSESNETNEEQPVASGSEVGQAAVAASAKNVEASPADKTASLSFTENDTLTWPVQGSIILDYSMEATTYFPTLDQYKYNPAVVIQSEEDSNVIAAADGVVESIENKDETGLTVTMDIGNGYKLIYGQLKNVDYSTGAYIKKGENIGVIAEPTKYYTIEGSNLFFEMTNNSVPVNPVTFLKDGTVTE